MVSAVNLYPISSFNSVGPLLERRLDPTAKPRHVIIGGLADQPPGRVLIHTAGHRTVRELECARLLGDERFLAELDQRARDAVRLLACPAT